MMRAGVRWDAGSEAPERRPKAGVGVGPCGLEDPTAELAPARWRDPLERRCEIEQVALGLVFPSFGFLEALFGGCEERVENVSHHRLRLLVEPTRSAP